MMFLPWSHTRAARTSVRIVITVDAFASWHYPEFVIAWGCVYQSTDGASITALFDNCEDVNLVCDVSRFCYLDRSLRCHSSPKLFIREHPTQGARYAVGRVKFGINRVFGGSESADHIAQTNTAQGNIRTKDCRVKDTIFDI